MPKTSLKVNQPAPDFTLPNQDGKPINLRELRGKWVILFAFLQAGSPDCTMQATGFRDRFTQITALNATVLGISANTPADLKAWHTAHKLPYDLLADADHSVLSAWGAWSDLSFKARSFSAPVRSLWVIDEGGMVVVAQVRITPAESVRHALDHISPPA